MNKKWIFLVQVFLIFLSISNHAKCISDVYRAGLEANSVSYDLKESDSSFATHATTSSVGLKFGKIWFCPREGLEVTAYGRFQRLTFDNKPNAVYSDLNDTEVLFSGGAEAKKAHSRNVEWVGDVELRQDLGFSANYSTSRLVSEKIINLKAMGGARYYIHSGDKYDISAKAKLGLLASPSDAGLGRIIGGNVEGLRRLGRKSSLKLDLFYDRYDQRFRNLDNTRKELGLRFNLVFRF